MNPYLIPVLPDLPHPLGRAGVNHDERNWDHRALVAPPPRATRPSQAWFTADVYDQGNTSSCTAQACVGAMNTAPFRTGFQPDRASYDQPAERIALYEASQLVDPWAGTPHDGSSTDAPFKVLRDGGKITAWKWLFGEVEVREYVTWYGPVVVGTEWLTDMFNPDAHGLLSLTGAVAGGHAYRLVQWSRTRDAYRMVNSWGRGWGQNGRAWIRTADMNRLLVADGDAVTIGT